MITTTRKNNRTSRRPSNLCLSAFFSLTKPNGPLTHRNPLKRDLAITIPFLSPCLKQRASDYSGSFGILVASGLSLRKVQITDHAIKTNINQQPKQLYRADATI